MYDIITRLILFELTLKLDLLCGQVPVKTLGTFYFGVRYIFRPTDNKIVTKQLVFWYMQISVRFFTTQGKKIAWRMIPFASSIYLIPTLSPTCLLHNHIYLVCGRYPPPRAGTYFLNDLHAVQEAVQAGTIRNAQHQKLY